jgi:myo-inositol-1(or 4)-monophosphatase
LRRAGAVGDGWVANQSLNAIDVDEIAAARTAMEAVAREAGRQLREAFAGPGVNVTAKSSPTDLVSEADHAAERLIRERLAAARPGDGFLGEEGGDAEGSSGLRWIVDPLDGTINFLFGIPQWAVSIACEDARGTIVGVVYDPMRDELWTAERDGPARLDGSEIHGSERSELATAMVATGFGYDAEVRKLQAEVILRLLPRVRDIRRLGSAALDLAWTAAGRYDAFYERGLNAWDLAAGALLCRRAGLAVRELAPTPPAAAGVLVAPDALVDALESLVAG